MRRTLSVVLLFAIAITWLPCRHASAQGGFVEGLFRTVAEAQLQREQRKRREADAARRAANPSPNSRAPFPPGRVPPPSRGVSGSRNTIRPVPYAPNMQPRVVNSPHVKRFTDALSGLIQEIKFLTSDLRSDAANNPSIRTLLPRAYQLTAQGEAILAQVQASDSLLFSGRSYEDFDAALRQLSFQVHSAIRLDVEAASHLKNAERYLHTMSEQLGTDVQIDRHALHDQLLIASTYIQALIDDLPLTPHASRADVRTLAHDGRLLRQAILQEADQIEALDYQQTCASFTSYAERWRTYASRVSQLNDPHLNQRLERLGECGERTYALLLMKPPVNTADLQAHCDHLHQLGDDVLDQLTLRTLTRLQPDTRIRVGDLSRQFDQAAHQLHEAASRKAAPSELARTFQKADQAWAQLSPILAGISKINRSTLSSVDRECEQLRRLLGVSNSVNSTVGYDDLVQIAASLEGTAEYLERDIKNAGRSIQHSGLRHDLTQASGDFHDASQHLHAKLYDRRPVSELRRDGEKMADAWRRMATAVNSLNSRGGAGGRGERIAQAMRDLQPKVASMAAALTIE